MKIEYIDHMGSDVTVVNAARVSFNKESPPLKPEENYLLRSKDAALISYLANHDHFTPFTHPQITLRETVPIFVARQRFKHTVGFSYNEVSRRYVKDEPEFFKITHWRGAPTGGAKQGSDPSTKIPINPKWLQELYDMSLQKYNQALSMGAAPEQARMLLPQAMYTSYYVTGSLAAFARAYNLRIDPHAQEEIREIAREWDRIIRPLFPVSWISLISETLDA